MLCYWFYNSKIFVSIISKISFLLFCCLKWTKLPKIKYINQQIIKKNMNKPTDNYIYHRSLMNRLDYYVVCCSPRMREFVGSNPDWVKLPKTWKLILAGCTISTRNQGVRTKTYLLVVRIMTPGDMSSCKLYLVN